MAKLNGGGTPFTFGYTITRFERTGDQLFVHIDATAKPVYIEHWFTADEQLNVKGTLEKLIADLSIMADNYQPPPVVTDAKSELSAVVVDMTAVQACKTAQLIELDSISINLIGG